MSGESLFRTSGVLSRVAVSDLHHLYFGSLGGARFSLLSLACWDYSSFLAIRKLKYRSPRKRYSLGHKVSRRSLGLYIMLSFAFKCKEKNPSVVTAASQ